MRRYNRSPQVYPSRYPLLYPDRYPSTGGGFTPSQYSQIYNDTIISPTWRNGGFETAGAGGADVFASWDEAVTGTSAISAETGAGDIYAGSKACKIVLDASGSYVTLTQSDILTAGKTYKVTAYMKASATTTVYLGRYHADNAVSVTSSTYTAYSATFVGAATYFQIRTGSNATRDIWIDNVTVEEVDVWHGNIVALDTNSGVPGVPRTNLIPANKVTFEGWTSGTGETITVTQGQAIDGYTTNGATRILGTGNGSTAYKYYIDAVLPGANGQSYADSVVVKNQGIVNVTVHIHLSLTPVIVIPGETKRVEITRVGNGVQNISLLFAVPLATDVLDIIAYQPQINLSAEALAFDNSPAIPAVVTNPLRDLSGLGNNGVVSGAVPVRVANGLAYSFDGVDDKVTITGDKIGTGDVTIEAWINPTGWGEGGYGRIFDNTKLTLAIQNASCWITSDQATTLDGTASSLALKTWHHVVATRTSAGVATIYINTEAKGAGASGTPTAGGNTLIGNNSAGDRTFAGSIAYPRVYNRILSPLEIRDNYNLDCATFGLPSK